MTKTNFSSLTFQPLVGYSCPLCFSVGMTLATSSIETLETK